VPAAAPAAGRLPIHEDPERIAARPDADLAEVAAWLAEHASGAGRVGVALTGTWGRGTGDITGIALATLYAPSPEGAYESLRYITHDAAFGHVLRGLHYFGASAMIVLIGAHLARVYLTASYKYPREVNWVTGTVLLLLTLIMAFTGQVIRWDQNGIWSMVVAAEQAGRIPWIGRWIAHFMLAGYHLGGPTLTRSFSWHVFFIPALLFTGIGLHIYLVLRNGISEPPERSVPGTRAPIAPGTSA